MSVDDATFVCDRKFDNEKIYCADFFGIDS